MQDYSKIDKRVNTLINKVSAYIPNFDNEYIKDEINKAYLYAR